jgi:hypothetical protein
MSDSREKVAIAFASACARRGLDLAVPFPGNQLPADALFTALLFGAKLSFEKLAARRWDSGIAGR